MPRRKILKTALMLTLATVAMRVSSGADEKKELTCGKPPVLMPGPKPTKEEQQKACKLRAEGVVTILVSEEGDVVNPTVGRTLSRQAAESTTLGFVILFLIFVGLSVCSLRPVVLAFFRASCRTRHEGANQQQGTAQEGKEFSTG